MAEVCLHCRFEGRVQGVGFRWSVKRICQLRHVRGWVTNLSDGSVEAVFVGSAESVSEVMGTIEGKRRFFLDQVIRRPTSRPATLAEEFEIRR